MAYGMLIDLTKCVGCGACMEACQEKNGQTGKESSELTASHYTVLQQYGDVNVRRLCMHCETPTCASVCPVGAFHKSESGAVLYDSEKCMGCRYCMQACPFQVPRYEWQSTSPCVRKCNMCADLVAAGKKTACAEACQVEATVFGERGALIKEARARIAGSPSSYIDRIYGMTEAGGTSVLFLSGVPFEKLGFLGNIPHESLPMLTWSVLSRVPKFAVTGSVMLAGVWWITKRREDVARSEAEEREERRRQGGKS